MTFIPRKNAKRNASIYHGSQEISDDCSTGGIGPKTNGRNPRTRKDHHLDLKHEGKKQLRREHWQHVESIVTPDQGENKPTVSKKCGLI